MRNQCPWCGAPIPIHGKDACLPAKKKMPVRFLYLRCPSCGQYSGQNYKSKRTVLCVLGMLASIVFPIPNYNLLLLRLIAILIFLKILLDAPLVKMDADENFITDASDSEDH